ncbi:UDP-D-galactose:(glucosyl)lipopolysaccharide-1,6-D-galactosyltransferase [compost metagenome]
MIGRLESGFQLFVDEYFKDYPWLIDKIDFKGEVNDRTELMNYYQKCKFFVLTSRHEGFPLVLLEAISNGCFILSSDFPAARDITDNGRYGRIFQAEDDETLAKLILNCDQNEFSLPSPQEMSTYADIKYNWKQVVYDIYLSLK